MPARADAQLRHARHAAYQADRSQAPLWCNHVPAWMVHADDPNQPAPPRRRPDRRARRRRRTRPTRTAARPRSARRLAGRLYAKLAEAIDRRWRWDRFPTPVSLALIMGIRDNLREHNLFDTNDAASMPTLPPEPPARYLVARSVDGSYNDLSAPAMGMAETRFGRNVPLDDTEPEDPERVLTPNPRLVSTRLLARGPEMIPATTLNVLAAAWLQFETRDWFSHGTDATRPFEVPRPPGDDWPTDPITLPRTRRDPTRGHRRTAHLRQHRDPLVGRVPDLRQHAGVPGRRAPPGAGQGQGRDRARTT